jgi:hypothetical protein
LTFQNRQNDEVALASVSGCAIEQRLKVYLGAIQIPLAEPLDRSRHVRVHPTSSRPPS